MYFIVKYVACVFIFCSNRLKANSYAASEHLRLVSKIMVLVCDDGARGLDVQYVQDKSAHRFGEEM